MLIRHWSPLRARLAGLAAAVDGIAAVEFALILPLLLVLYFGSIEVTQAVRASRKVDLVASALANLASQQSTCSAGSTPCLTEADMTGSNGIFTAAAAIMAPFDTTTLQMTISQVTISTYNTALIAKVDWTVTNNGGSPRPCNGGGPNNSLLSGTVRTSNSSYQFYMPPSYTMTGAPTGSMMVADVVYQYKPGMGWNFFEWSNTATAFQMASIGYYRNRNTSGGTAGPVTPSMSSGLTKCS